MLSGGAAHRAPLLDDSRSIELCGPASTFGAIAGDDGVALAGRTGKPRRLRPPADRGAQENNREPCAERAPVQPGHQGAYQNEDDHESDCHVHRSTSSRRRTGDALVARKDTARRTYKLIGIRRRFGCAAPLPPCHSPKAQNQTQNERPDREQSPKPISRGDSRSTPVLFSLRPSTSTPRSEMATPAPRSNRTANEGVRDGLALIAAPPSVAAGR